MMETNKLKIYVDKITATYKDDKGINFIDVNDLPQREKIIEILELIMEVVFPGYTGKRPVTKWNIDYILGDIISQVYTDLVDQSEKALQHLCRIKKDCDRSQCRQMAQKAVDNLLEQLPHIREVLKTDVNSAYDGDPAAQSFEEIIISYPGIIAIATHRVAHELYKSNIPLIPRIMSEYAHKTTGIDIHPGAEIGANFFIDHGTGVVIGETAVIGSNVKIYQGVTLGALSFPKDERGRVIKGGKRHPTIEDNVTIYAEATILGDIVIGRDSVIGGNTWVKDPVPAGHRAVITHTGTTIKKPGSKKTSVKKQ
jgi:serine O-acetyltransferase